MIIITYQRWEKPNMAETTEELVKLVETANVISTDISDSVLVLEDHGYSGRCTNNRPNYQRMLSLLRARRARGIVTSMMSTLIDPMDNEALEELTQHLINAAAFIAFEVGGSYDMALQDHVNQFRARYSRPYSSSDRHDACGLNGAV